MLRVQNAFKNNKIYTHNLLFQEFVNIPLNELNIKLMTLDGKYHKKKTLVPNYISSIKRFITFQNYSIILYNYHQFLPKKINKTE